jgi:hypothetical protein
MLRAFVEEAAALVSLALFLGMIAIWAQVLATPETAAPAIQVNGAPKGDWLRGVVLRGTVPPDSGEPPEVQVLRNPTRALPDGCESASGPMLPATKPSRYVT